MDAGIVTAWATVFGVMIAAGGFLVSIRSRIDKQLSALSKRFDERLNHLDTCIDEGKRENRADFDTLKTHLNGVQLELAREYVRRPELRQQVEDLRADIDLAGRMTRLENSGRRGVGHADDHRG